MMKKKLPCDGRPGISGAACAARDCLAPWPVGAVRPRAVPPEPTAAIGTQGILSIILAKYL